MDDARTSLAVFGSALGGALVGALATWLAVPTAGKASVSAMPAAPQVARQPDSSLTGVESESLALKVERLAESLEALVEQLPGLMASSTRQEVVARTEQPHEAAGRPESPVEKRPSGSIRRPALRPAPAESRIGLVEPIQRLFETDDEGTYEDH